MKRKVKLSRKQNRMVLKAMSKGTIRSKLKYLIQTNDLFLIDEIKQLKNVDGIEQRLNKIQLSVEIIYQIKKNEYNEKILYVKFLKTGSSLDDRLFDLNNQLQSLFNAKMLERNNEIDYIEYILLYKESKEKEECDLNKKIYYNPTGKISLSKRYEWEYISKPHLLLAGNSGTGKSYLLLSLIHKMKSETTKDKILICDGKFDELKHITGKDMKLPMVANDIDQIKNFIEMTNDVMELRYEKNDTGKDPIFLIIDEFAALSLVIEKKEFNELNRKLKNIILKGRAANIHVLIAMQRASSDSIDLAIRDNTSIRIGLGNLSVENFKMVFGESKSENELLNRKVGQGYILIDGENLGLFDSPYIRMIETNKQDVQ